MHRNHIISPALNFIIIPRKFCDNMTFSINKPNSKLQLIFCDKTLRFIFFYHSSRQNQPIFFVCKMNFLNTSQLNLSMIKSLWVKHYQIFRVLQFEFWAVQCELCISKWPISNNNTTRAWLVELWTAYYFTMHVILTF